MKVCWVKIWIASMATLTERFRDDEGRVDFEALGREEYAFRHALITGDYYKSERARDLAEAAEKDYKIHSENGKKGGRPKKLTAAATTREGVEFESDSGDAASLESATACNHYDQETKVSANSPAGDGVNLDITHTISPDASSGNAEEVVINGSPITRNGSRANCTLPTSGQTIEVLEQAGAVEVPPESVFASSTALPVPAKRRHGEFGNVMLTDDEFAKLCGKCQDADALITELDQYIESQGKTKKYKNHYATLLNWSRRKAQEAKPQQRYKNINDINQENYEKAMREIEAMCAVEAV